MLPGPNLHFTSDQTNLKYKYPVPGAKNNVDPGRKEKEGESARIAKNGKGISRTF